MVDFSTFQSGASYGIAFFGRAVRVELKTHNSFQSKKSEKIYLNFHQMVKNHKNSTSHAATFLFANPFFLEDFQWGSAFPLPVTKKYTNLNVTLKQTVRSNKNTLLIDIPRTIDHNSKPWNIVAS